MTAMRWVAASLLLAAGCSTAPSAPSSRAGGAVEERATTRVSAAPDDPRLVPEPALSGALEEPSAEELYRYLFRHTGTPLTPSSYCGGRLEGERGTLGEVLASYLGTHDGRRYFEIGCGRPGDRAFEVQGAPSCPPAGSGGEPCLPCVMLMWVDDVTEDPALFLIAGRLHFQFRAGDPLEPSSIFCTEAG